MNAQLVIGAGEVGTALAEVLGCDLRDVSPHTGIYPTLHITFPWSGRFVSTVQEYVAIHGSELVIVHSTVPVGTCDEYGWVHSPVRGRHPDLAPGLLAFPKHIGGEDEFAVEAASELMEKAGMETVLHSCAAVTEAGKLWELATYGAEIAIEKRIWDWCDRQGLSFREVYREFGQTYNLGWIELGEGRFVKRLIDHQPGPIGGHCVAQNAPMLEEDWLNQLMNPYRPE